MASLEELFTVAAECRQLGLRAGAIVFSNVSITQASPELRETIAREAEAVPRRCSDPAAVRALSEVQAFQEVLRKVGANPRRDQSSVERLLRYALQRGTLPAINGLVDAYNLVSLRTLCSLGAHDLDRLTPPISLRILTGSETFTPLGSAVAVPVNPGEFAYADGSGRVLCRMDVVQADFSKVAAPTKNAVLIIEGTTAHADDAFNEAVAQSVTEITRACGGCAKVIAVP